MIHSSLAFIFLLALETNDNVDKQLEMINQ